MHNIPNTHEVRIETSTLCNAACVFCPWPTDGFTRKKEVMSYDDYAFYQIHTYYNPSISPSVK